MRKAQRGSEQSIGLQEAFWAPLEPSIVEGDREKEREPLSLRECELKTSRETLSPNNHSTRVVGVKAAHCRGTRSPRPPRHANPRPVDPYNKRPRTEGTPVCLFPERHEQTHPFSSSSILCHITQQSPSAEITAPSVNRADWPPAHCWRGGGRAENRCLEKIVSPYPPWAHNVTQI